MARDPKEDVQRREDDDQPVGAAAGGPYIPSISSEVIVSDPLVTMLNKLPKAIVENKLCRFFNESDFLDKPGYLDNSDMIALSMVSKATHGFFQPYPLQILADKLLLQVMRGEQTSAEDLLKSRPSLLLEKGTATDFSGRKFHCTAFQYALWALDTRYMCQMMLDCLPYSSEGERIKQGLLEQFRALESNGIKYQLEDKIMLEKHYDFTPLLIGLKTYADNYPSPKLDWIERKKQWNELVGVAQRYVPAHVAQHYCDPDESFCPIPTFTKPKFSRILKFVHETGVMDCEAHWFSPVVHENYVRPLNLGEDFGISRCELIKTTSVGHPTGRHAVFYNSAFGDLKALTALCQVRTQDLELLQERLLSPLQEPEPEPDFIIIERLQSPLQKPKRKSCVIC